MSVLFFNPSPLEGEGYADLPRQVASRSWMRGRERQAGAPALRALTPHPAATRRTSRQVYSTLSLKGRGEVLL